MNVVPSGRDNSLNSWVKMVYQFYLFFTSVPRSSGRFECKQKTNKKT